MKARSRQDGQSLVEFSLVVTVFLMLLMAVFDLGRGIYQYNGVSEAAREIARVTSVHPCTGSPCTLGNSLETARVIAIQKTLIPNLGTPAFFCVDIDGTAKDTTTSCIAGDQLKVVIAAPYGPITPLMGFTGTWNFQSSSTVSVQ